VRKRYIRFQESALLALLFVLFAASLLVLRVVVLLLLVLLVRFALILVLVLPLRIVLVLLRGHVGCPNRAATIDRTCRLGSGR